MNVSFRVSGCIHKKSQEVRMASLLNVIGKEGMDMYDTFKCDHSSDALKIDQVLQKLEERCVPARKEVNVSSCRMNRLIVVPLH